MMRKTLGRHRTSGSTAGPPARRKAAIHVVEDDDTDIRSGD